MSSRQAASLHGRSSRSSTVGREAMASIGKRMSLEKTRAENAVRSSVPSVRHAYGFKNGITFHATYMTSSTPIIFLPGTALALKSMVSS